MKGCWVASNTQLRMDDVVVFIRGKCGVGSACQVVVMVAGVVVVVLLHQYRQYLAGPRPGAVPPPFLKFGTGFLKFVKLPL